MIEYWNPCKEHLKPYYMSNAMGLGCNEFTWAHSN